MESFLVQRSLLNPKFESYKLDIFSQYDAIHRYDLPFKPSRSTVSSSTPLTFQEMQSRISHNHLSLSRETGQAIYVDSANQVIVVKLGDGTPAFRVVYHLPETVASTSGMRPEYPTAVFFQSDVIFVADGNGLLYVLNLPPDSESANVVGIFTTSPGSLESPFRIHFIHRESSNVALVIVSARCYDSDPSRVPTSTRPKIEEFDVCAIRINLSMLHPTNIVPLPLIWRRRGKEVPIYGNYDPALNAFLLVGGSTYRELSTPTMERYDPSQDEYVPIPRANENLDDENQGPPKPHPYSWTQTSDSVTVAFPLPSNTPKSKIKVLFSPKTLTLHVEPDNSAADPLLPLPRYSAKLLWDTISPSTSLWTWDREGEHSSGLLTLHLDKANEGVKWMQVFASAAVSTSQNSLPEDVEVPETLDPSELWRIREALDKYTEALRPGGAGYGLGTGVPSLAEGEMDDEVDQSVGKETYQTWITPDGEIPAWWKNARDIPFQLLSTPLPGQAVGSSQSLIVKTHIDGAVFSLNHDSADAPRWEHTSTFPALAFVLASKRDTCFTHHIDEAVLAFEGGVKDRGGHLYVYHAAPSSSKWAKQAIVKVDDGRGGSLLGVGLWNTEEGPVVVCMTEGELVLVKLF